MHQSVSLQTFGPCRKIASLWKSVISFWHALQVAVDESRARAFLWSMVEEQKGLPAKFLQK